ncbi:Uncharacterised protein [uncultured Eubacterium sp.]|nr:Uncharacterised protein [uncultured Eubacterium sp.]
MSYIIFFLPPVAAMIVLLIAIKNGFNKQAFVVSAGITMVINMFAIHKLTWYGLICTLTVPLAAIYVLICLWLSIRERRSDRE